MKKYFGTDGIRGKVNDDLTINLVEKIGRSLKYFKSQLVVVAYDTRESNQMLSYSLKSGILSVGINVIDAGILPTPALAYYSWKKQIIGIMITASHNPYTDNGIKIFNKGLKLTLEEEINLEKLIDNPPSYSSSLGYSYNSDEPIDIYLEFLKSFIYKTNQKIVVDFANGANYIIGNKIFNQVSNHIFITNNNPNGKNINTHVGAVYPNYIAKLCKEKNYDIGFCFDGDGDRVLAVDKNGKIYYGDQIIYIISNYLKENNLLNNNTIVLTTLSNVGTINSFKEKGINVIISDVGDKNILELLDKNNLSIGGENSGHIILYDSLFTGDGILTAIFLIMILEKTKSTLYDLTKEITIYPEKMINIPTDNKDIIKDADVLEIINQFMKKYPNEGKIVLRNSGTEPCLRLLVSHKEESIMNKYLLLLKDKIELLNKREE